MTEIEQTEDWSDVEHSADASYPEYPANPHNHRFTISIDTRGPHLAIRGNTAQEIADAYAEAEAIGLTAQLAGIWSHMKAEFQTASGLGPVSPVPAGPPAPPQGAPTPPPFGPNVSVPGAPGYAGPPAPAAPPAAPQWGGQQQGGQGNRGPKPRPAEWPVCFRIEVPFPAKEQFKQYREQNKDYFKGKVMWAGGGGYWVHGDVVQALGAYNPVPA